MITLILFSFFKFSFAADSCEDFTPSKSTCAALNLSVSSDARSDIEKCQLRKCGAWESEQEEQKEKCKAFEPDLKAINNACSKLGLPAGQCTDTLAKCSNYQVNPPRPSASGGSSRARAARQKQCSFLNELVTTDRAEDLLDDAKDEFEDSETALQDLQDALKEAQENALEKQQSTEEEISELQSKLSQIPNKVQEILLKNEGERDKTLLTHIDNLNKITDELQAITDSIHDAETQLINKRNELLTQCEVEARTKQQAKIAEKNQRRAAGKYTVASLSDAIQTSQKSKLDGKPLLRNTKEIIQRFERCQKTRLHQTGLQAAERNYQRTLIALESRRKSIEKQQAAISARLESSLKMNNKVAELELAGVAQEQSAMQQQVLMLQKQLMESKLQDQSNIQQIQSNIQKKQFEQYGKLQGLMQAQGLVGLSTSRRGGKLNDDDIDDIQSAMSILGARTNEFDIDGDYNNESPAKLIKDLQKTCPGAGGLRFGTSGGNL